MLAVHPLVLGVRDTHTVTHLAAKLKSAKHALIVGNGAIAAELVASSLPCPTTWAMRDGYVGHTFFDASASAFFDAAPPAAVDASSTQQKVLQSVDCRPAAEAASSSPGGEAQPKRARGGAGATDTSPAVHGNALGPQWTSVLKENSAGSQLQPHTAERRFGVEVEAIRALNPAAVAPPLTCVGQWFSLLKGSTEGTNSDDSDLVEESSNFLLEARLTDGSTVLCDVIVSATGVQPRTTWLPETVARGPCGGIAVNKFMQSSCSRSLFAAGDAASLQWPPSPLWFQMRTWSQARLQGLYAAWCMAGVVGDSIHDTNMPPHDSFIPRGGDTLARLAVAHAALAAGQLVEDAEDDEDLMVGGGGFDLFAHMTRYMGFKVILLGLFNGQGLGMEYEAAIQKTTADQEGLQSAPGTTMEGESTEAEAPTGTARFSTSVQVLYRVTPGVEYVKLVLLNGRVVGALLIGDTDLEETCENLIMSRLDVGSMGIDMLHPDLDLEDFFD